MVEKIKIIFKNRVEIATQGKNHAINNLSNDRAVESLVELIKEIT